MKKQFVLDTNVLLHNSHSLFDIKDNDLVLPIEVIDELDHFKLEADYQDSGRTSDKGQTGRRCLSWKRGMLRVLVQDTSGENIQGLAPDIMDNRIHDKERKKRPRFAGSKHLIR